MSSSRTKKSSRHTHSNGSSSADIVNSGSNGNSPSSSRHGISSTQPAKKTKLAAAVEVLNNQNDSSSSSAKAVPENSDKRTNNGNKTTTRTDSSASGSTLPIDYPGASRFRYSVHSANVSSAIENQRPLYSKHRTVAISKQYKLAEVEHLPAGIAIDTQVLPVEIKGSISNCSNCQLVIDKDIRESYHGELIIMPASNKKFNFNVDPVIFSTARKLLDEADESVKQYRALFAAQTHASVAEAIAASKTSSGSNNNKRDKRSRREKPSETATNDQDKVVVLRASDPNHKVIDVKSLLSDSRVEYQQTKEGDVVFDPDDIEQVILMRKIKAIGSLRDRFMRVADVPIYIRFPSGSTRNPSGTIDISADVAVYGIREFIEYCESKEVSSSSPSNGKGRGGSSARSRVDSDNYDSSHGSGGESFSGGEDDDDDDESGGGGGDSDDDDDGDDDQDFGYDD